MDAYLDINDRPCEKGLCNNTPLCPAESIGRNGDRWMLSAQFECARPAPFPARDITVGVDRGVGTLASVFDGTTFEDVAANIYWYGEERQNRAGNGPTCVEMGDQELAPVPVSETRISAYEKQ